MNILKQFVSSLGQQNAPFGFAPDDPNASYKAGLSYIGDIGAGLMANNQPGVSPWANLGASLQQAKASSYDRNRQQYTAQQLMEEAAARKAEREQRQAEIDKRNAWLKSIRDPKMRATLEANPTLIDNYITATDPAFQKPEKPTFMEVNGKIINPVTREVIYDGGSKPLDLPPGYMWNEDGTEAIPIKGTQQWRDAQTADSAANNKSGSKTTVTQTVVNAADKARKLVSGWSTGNVGKVAALSGTSDAAEIYRQVEVLKSVASVENINAMRRESPTGAALGAASDKDLALLAAKAGALDPSAGEERFNAQLDDYELTLLQTIHGNEEGTRIFNDIKAGKGDFAPTTSDAGAAEEWTIGSDGKPKRVR